MEVEQKTKQIGLEKIAVEQILNNTLPTNVQEARTAVRAITLADYEAELINNDTIPEVVQVCVG